MRVAVALLALALGTAAVAQSTDPTLFARQADIAAQVTAMEHDMKPGQGFLWRPLLGKGAPPTAALEIWRTPGKPAVHPTDYEYATVVKGDGTLVSGGTLADAAARNPSLTEGSRIVDGTTRALHVGDTFLVPPGTPHWFGIEPGHELVLLGVKIAQPAR